eukprot:scaffold11043_cov122-Cylindrotheca_fusiformis.AAC.7
MRLFPTHPTLTLRPLSPLRPLRNPGDYHAPKTSQRRGGTAKEETIPFMETLVGDQAGPSTSDVENQVAIETSNTDSVEDVNSAKKKQIEEWKDGPFAASMVPTWEEERSKFDTALWKELDRGTGATPCICCSAFICSKVGAGRIGHMAILKQTTEWVEEVEEDENGEARTRRFTRPKLDMVVGPYWPMLFLTYSLILGVSAGLIVSLALTSFRDPGILPRYEKPPPTEDATSWRWSDRTHSYQPRGSFYDQHTGAVVEAFDHTCIWTGTAIGKKNIGSFRLFVALLFVCLTFDIVLLADATWIETDIVSMKTVQFQSKNFDHTIGSSLRLL